MEPMKQQIAEHIDPVMHSHGLAGDYPWYAHRKKDMARLLRFEQVSGAEPDDADHALLTIRATCERMGLVKAAAGQRVDFEVNGKPMRAMNRAEMTWQVCAVLKVDRGEDAQLSAGQRSDLAGYADFVARFFFGKHITRQEINTFIGRSTWRGFCKRNARVAWVFSLIFALMCAVPMALFYWDDWMLAGGIMFVGVIIFFFPFVYSVLRRLR